MYVILKPFLDKPLSRNFSVNQFCKPGQKLGLFENGLKHAWTDLVIVPNVEDNLNSGPASLPHLSANLCQNLGVGWKMTCK